MRGEGMVNICLLLFNIVILFGIVMKDEAERLARLERNLNILRASDPGIRREEYKRQVLREIERVISEYGQRDVSLRVERMNDILYCSKRRFCMNVITSKVETASMAYLRDDWERTLYILKELERQIEEGADDCEEVECHAYARSLVSEVITVFEVAIRIEQGIRSIPCDPERSVSLDPKQVSSMLAPLSHPIRVSILLKLDQGGLGFSELSRELDLRTGHLQFHLRALEEAGYVRQERRGGQYVISIKGMTAVAGLRALMTDLIEMSGHREDAAKKAEAA